nr:SAM-dependent methyltransferase [Comamonas serinivorans]
MVSPLSAEWLARLQPEAEQGFIPFDRFMAQALYAPGLGYYSGGRTKFGALPQSGSDFITAPELSPLFGQAVAVQVAQMLAELGSDEVWEFGAGSGALAEQVLGALAEQGVRVARYHIVDLSGSLRARQQQRLSAYGEQVCWHDRLPENVQGVVLGNELLDAMPVQLLARVNGAWHERGVVLHDGALVWADRPTALRPPVEVEGDHDYVTEVHPQAEAFIATLAEAFARNQAAGGPGGCALLLDYGFPEAEYYHPQRSTGTLVCHQLHQVDDNPLIAVGEKDITAHVNFTGIALAAQQAGMAVLGYTSQAHFLINCGLTERMQAAALPQRAQAMKLIAEHEMGELFKVLAFTSHPEFAALGFAHGDRSHRL